MNTAFYIARRYLVARKSHNVINVISAISAAGTDTPAGEVVQAQGSAVNDAISALVNLGYARMDASMAVAKSFKKRGENAKVDELIRDALKEFAP